MSDKRLALVMALLACLMLIALTYSAMMLHRTLNRLKEPAVLQPEPAHSVTKSSQDDDASSQDDDVGPPSDMELLRMQQPALPSYCDRQAYRGKPECQPKAKLRWHSGNVVGC